MRPKNKKYCPFGQSTAQNGNRLPETDVLPETASPRTVILAALFFSRSTRFASCSQRRIGSCLKRGTATSAVTTGRSRSDAGKPWHDVS